MAKFPGLMIWTDAFMADTVHLSRDEMGAYWLLLLTAWRRPTCDLPDDDEFLAGVTRTNLRTWKARLRPVMAQFHSIENGMWTQKRLKKEWEFVHALMAKRKAAAGVRWSKNKELVYAGADAKAMQNDAPIPTSTSIQEVSKKKVTPSLRDGATIFPAWWPLEAWDGFVAMRRAIRAPLTPRAVKLTIAKIEKFKMLGNDPAAVLDQSTVRAWRGLFPLHADADGGAVKKSPLIDIMDKEPRDGTD